ncbi:MAG: acyl--CoA ligase [Clostridia bacterium]|nr:acyl--CoA ligase [Clostridia bacterium]
MGDAEKGLLQRLRERAEQEPGKRLFGGDEWLNTAQVLALTEQAAAYFRREGLGGGAYVALACSNRALTAIALLALRAAGAVVVLLDPRQPVQEALAHTETPIPVEAYIAQAEDGTFRIDWLLRPGGGQTVLDLHKTGPVGEGSVLPSAHEPAFIIFTSGSTGKSKAVVLTEANLISNLVDAEPFGDYRQDDIALISLPFHHVFGMVLLLGTVILGYSACFTPRADVPGLLATIQEQRITRMNGVPSLYLAMAERCGGYDLSSLRVGFVGGSPITPEQYAFAEARLGMTLIQAYGMSECASISIGSSLDPQELRLRGNGRFYPRTTWMIRRADGSAAAPGEEGEILVNSPARMLGYYGSPMPQEEMIRTGDLGYVDGDGILHLTGRIKDILIRNGNNLSPARIEQALLALPGVRDAVVVGIADDRQGEVPAAMVVADGEARTLTPDLAKNECPVLYAFVSRIPLTASGKPDRVLIRDMLSARRRG